MLGLSLNERHKVGCFRFLPLGPTEPHEPYSDSTGLMTVPKLGTVLECSSLNWHSCCVQDAERNWQFDIFQFADATPGETLSMLSYHMFKQSGLVEELHMDEPKMIRALQRIEAGYDINNPYHNRWVIHKI